MRCSLPIAIALLALTGCEKEVEVELPEGEVKLVVEGTIEPGQPPLVILTRTQGFFAPTDINSIADIFVKDATVTVTHGSVVDTLDRICSGSLTQEQLEQAAALTGLDPALLNGADICIYSKLDGSLLGEIGGTYALGIVWEGGRAEAVTNIPNPVVLDSLWFELSEQDADDDTSGYVWARRTDPDTMGNNTRWMARRISRVDGQAEDASFIAPLGGTFTDTYFNGLTFDFFAVRGNTPFETDDAENNDKFHVGDTVVVKLVSFGKAEFEFYSSYELNVLSQGDMFSTPTNVRSNINGGLGVWAGWGYVLDTVICQL